MAYKLGTRLIWKDLNLRSWSNSMVLLAIEGREYKVKFEYTGVTGNVLAYQVFAYNPEDRGSDSSPNYNNRSPQEKIQARNEIIGMSWDELEHKQGGKLKR